MRPLKALLYWLLSRVAGLEPTHHRERIDTVDPEPHLHPEQKMSPGSEAHAPEPLSSLVKDKTASSNETGGKPQKLARSLHESSTESNGQVHAVVPAKGMELTSLSESDPDKPEEGGGDSLGDDGTAPENETPEERQQEAADGAKGGAECVKIGAEGNRQPEDKNSPEWKKWDECQGVLAEGQVIEAERKQVEAAKEQTKAEAIKHKIEEKDLADPGDARAVALLLALLALG